MIIMLNGSFGVGKTTTAEALQHALPHAMLFDPEEVGWLLRALTKGVQYPHEATDDFQDLGLWPTMTVLTAEQLYRHYRRPLIVPMTIVKQPYLDAIRSGFARITPHVFHFCLTASLPAIHRRLLERREQAGGWPWRMAEQCVPALQSQRFAEHIDTEQRSPADVVEHILERIHGVV